MSELRSTLERRADYLVLGVYTALTLVLTYPMVLRLSSSARDWGDPFLNAWIMAWQLDKWAALDLAGYFDTNVFFPHLNTLAYSEFLFPQMIVAAPIYYLSGNALLAYNVVLLLSLAASAMCAYLLVKHLTGSVVAGFVAGLIFAFNPFMFDHLSHLQVIGAAGIPLAFLWLHRYFETGEFRYMGFFTATYVAQALGNAYFAVYLTYAAAAFILYRAVVDRRLLRPRFWGHMTAHVLLSVLLLAPFYVHYLRLREDVGFSRTMAEVGGWPFLATAAINRLYGPLTINWSSPEAKLFPGFLAAGLALVGIAWILWGRAPKLRGPNRIGRSEIGYRVLGWLAFAVLWLAISIATGGGIRGTVFGVEVRATGVDRALVVVLVCLLARAVMRWRHEGLRILARRGFDDGVFYIGLLVTAVVLSMGEAGPYRLLFEYVPGFNAIRAVARIHILTMLAVSVLAGIAVHKLRSRFAGLARPAVVAVIVALICVEYVSVPVPLFTPDPPPAVDRWMAEQAGDFAVIYYPILARWETQRMYRSLSHGKKIVNGYSGFPAPVYRVLEAREFGTERTIDDLEALGVRYVVVYQNYYHERAIAIRQQLRTLEPRLRRVAELGDHLVYELEAPWLTRQQVYERLDALASAAQLQPLARDGWMVSVNENPNEADLAIDGDQRTRWRTRVQEAGMQIAVDIGSPERIAGVSMRFGNFVRDFPRGFRVDVSDDGAGWRTVWQDLGYELPITEFLRPTEMRVEALFDVVLARYVRVVIVGPRRGLVWSITEFDVLVPAP